jgi:hypothetical protein
MRSLVWLAVLLAGFGLMLFSWWHYQRIANPNPWTEVFMYVGTGQPDADVADLPCEAVRVRSLPISDVWRDMVRGLRATDPAMARGIESSLGGEVVWLPRFRDAFKDADLASGRMPRPGADEILAGFDAPHKDVLEAWGRRLTVVGVLHRSVALFAKGYVVPGDAAGKDLFEASGGEVSDGYILRLTAREAVQPQMRKRLVAAFPAAKFRVKTGTVRVAPGPYYLYLGGMALLLLGGSALFIRLYGWLAGVIPFAWLRAPLEAARAWPRLLAGLHGLVFGALIVAAALVYLVPPVQDFLLAVVGQAIASGRGPLGVAGKAYLGGSIPWAAAVTLAVNFFIGSVAYITLPSIVIPGIGILGTVFRGLMIGVLLAPSMLALSTTMLPHSLTVLVEMEAYVLAAFFAALIPIYIFRKAEGPTWWRRYGRALLLNVEANAVIFIMLAVVALYEATEVILMMR